MTDVVFGYGSLVTAATGTSRADLLGVRRAWTVAMDNTLDLPGYKHYLDAADGRPAVCVAFLDLVDAGGVVVNGVCRPVGAAELAALDRRERQYDRVEVTDRMAGAASGRVWTYVGRAASRERATRARDAGTLRVARDYLDAVLTAFDRLGADERRRFDASTDPPAVPVVDLRRVDAPW